MIKKKIRGIQKLINEQKIDTLLVGNFGHQIGDDLLYYLLLKKLEVGVLLIPQKGKPTLYAIPFEVAQLQRSFPDIAVEPFDTKVGEVLGNKSKMIGIRANALPSSVFQELKKNPNYTIIELQNCEQIFATKLPEEMRVMQKAADITGFVFEQALRNWKKFKTEVDAANFINHLFVSLGYEPSFPTIVASGKHAAHPHHVPANAKLQKGFCVIDMGVRLHGYCSDMTRTIYLGTPTAKDKALYDVVLHAQEHTIAQVRPGIATKTLDEYCRALLGTKLSQQFIHGLGHGVGTQVHEWPSVSARSEAVLQENMIITIEPGVYQKNAYGIRIEDDVVVKKNKPIVLTKTSKKLLVV